MATKSKKPKRPAWFILSCATIELETLPTKKPTSPSSEGLPVQQYKILIRKPAQFPPQGLWCSDHVFDCTCADEPLLIDANRVDRRHFEEILTSAAENKERLERARATKDLAVRGQELRMLDGSPIAFYVQKVTFGPLVEKKGVTKKAKKAKKAAKKPAKKRA